MFGPMRTVSHLPFIFVLTALLLTACAGPGPTGTPIPTAVPTYELEVKADPPEAAEFLLNPRSSLEGAYPAGTTVTIDVLPKAGWEVQEWVGPVYDVAGKTAKIDVDASRAVAVRLARPTLTPAPTPLPPRPTPVVIEKEIIVEKEVIKVVPVEVVVVRDVVKEVPKEVVVIKEVPVEVVREVAVVVEKEVVVIKEVPVEVVREVVVVKEVQVVATPTPVPPTPTHTPTARPTPTPAPTVEAMARGQAYYGGVVPMSSVGAVWGWDPHKHGRAEDIHANGLTYNQIVEYNPLSASEIICDLCDNWTVGPNFLVYTFNIQKGVTFQDGENLDADDVVFSVDRLIHEGKGRAGLFRPYLRDENPVEKVDSHTVMITLKQPSGAFLRFLAVDFNKVLPQHVASVKDMELYENWSGSGPWRAVSWNQGISYEFEANPNYFKKGRPFFGGIKGFQIVDIGTETAAYRTERILMPMDSSMQMGLDDHKRLQQDAEFTSRLDLFWLNGTAH